MVPFRNVEIGIPLGVDEDPTSQGRRPAQDCSEQMHAFHNALLEQASAVLSDFRKKIEQRISNNPYGRLSSSGSDLGLLLPPSLAASYVRAPQGELLGTGMAPFRM